MFSIKKLENYYHGDTCYIIGNGPSIKFMDFGSLKKFPTIVVGQVHMRYDFTKLNVKFWMCIEPWFFTPWIFRKIFWPATLPNQDLVLNYKAFIKENPNVSIIVHLSNILSLFSNNVHFLFRKFPKSFLVKNGLIGFSNFFHGSFIASISFAYFLGFKKIYLIGFDSFTLVPCRDSRFYEYGLGEISEKTYEIDKLLEFYKKVMNIVVIKHEESIHSDFESETYECHTGEVNKYKENFELMLEKDILMLHKFKEDQIKLGYNK